MAIKRVPKQKVASTPRAAPSDDRRAVCATCGAEHDKTAFPFVMASLLDPTEYACGLKCYKKWQSKQPKVVPL